MPTLNCLYISTVEAARLSRCHLGQESKSPGLPPALSGPWWGFSLCWGISARLREVHISQTVGTAGDQPGPLYEGLIVCGILDEAPVDGAPVDRLTSNGNVI